MKCWSCQKECGDPFAGKISFRATCDSCGAALHCCRNCKFHKPRLPNECAVPNTEFIADRSAPNFCEEFQLRDHTQEVVKKVDPTQAFRKLFRDE